MRIAATVLASVTVLSLNILPVQARCSVQSFNFPFGQPGASANTTMTVSGGAKPAPRKKVKQAPRAARANAQRQAAQAAAPVAVAITSNAAIGSHAPAGSAPALAFSQGSLTASQPGSVVSDKILRDVVPVGADYNETVKATPGFLSNNANGAVGDSKSGWRGYVDGQFNITFDGVPFGDANDPTHHSAAYFPASFLSRVTVDRGPGSASQVGYLVAPNPVYPTRSRRAGEEGVSTLRVLVDAGGQPTQVSVQASSGYPALDESALAAVRAAKFRPYVEAGQAQPVWVTISIRFKLQ